MQLTTVDLNPSLRCKTYIKIMDVKHSATNLQSTFRCATSFSLKWLISHTNEVWSCKWGVDDGVIWFVHLLRVVLI